MAEATIVPVTPDQLRGMEAKAPTPPTQPTPPTAPQPTAPQQPPAEQPKAAPTQDQGNDLVDMLKEAIEAAKTAQPKPAADKPADAPTGGLNDLTEDDISDPAVRSLGSLLRASAPGLDLERTIGKAIEHGDPTLVDAAYLREKFPDKADALIDLAGRIVEAVEAESNSTVASIHTEAGGEETWNAAVAAFNSNAPQAIKQVIVDLLNSPKTANIKKGAQFIVDFAKQGGFINTPAKLLAGQPSAGNAANVDPAKAPLDEANFKNEMIQLRIKHAHDPFDQAYVQERNSLMERRQRGKQSGL